MFSKPAYVHDKYICKKNNCSPCLVPYFVLFNQWEASKRSSIHVSYRRGRCKKNLSISIVIQIVIRCGYSLNEMCDS